MDEMKRSYLLLVLCVFACISTTASTRAAIMLLHNGNGTTYDNNKLADAIAGAEHGDTIYLSEGAFDVDTLIINKVVSIIGVGEATKIRGDIHIGIDDNPKTSNYMFDAVNIQGDVKVIKELRGLRFRKCKMYTFWASADVSDVAMDRCCISTFLPVDKIKNAYCSNCYISSVGYEYSFSTQAAYSSAIDTSSKGNDLNFLNCTILRVYASTSGGWNVLAKDAAFVNCHIGSCTTYGGENCSFTNTLLGNKELNSSCAVHNCYYDTYYLMKDYTEEQLITNGYFGNDGTVVGYMGGSTPYTLVPSGINVTESLLKVDLEKKELNVTLKISANQ